MKRNLAHGLLFVFNKTAVQTLERNQRTPQWHILKVIIITQAKRYTAMRYNAIIKHKPKNIEKNYVNQNLLMSR